VTQGSSTTRSRDLAASPVVDGPIGGRRFDDPITHEPSGTGPADLPPIDTEAGKATDEGRAIDGHPVSHDPANEDPVGVGLELTQLPEGTLHA
jgi:hypothetical protein